MTDVANKVAIITGAGSGIGRGIALAYGGGGAKVVVASLVPESVDAVAGEIRDHGGTALGVVCDVGQRDQVFALIDQTVAEFGALDVLINNAQSFSGPNTPSIGDGQQPLETFNEEDWEVIYRTGVMGTLWGMKAAFPHMKGRGGKIINFGSMAGQVGQEGFAAYNACKEGIRALTRTAAREWGRHKINVNVINPIMNTAILSQMGQGHPGFLEQLIAGIPLGRLGDPEKDAGALATFLGSSDSDYLTGMTFMLDGGCFISP